MTLAVDGPWRKPLEPSCDRPLEAIHGRSFVADRASENKSVIPFAAYENQGTRSIADLHGLLRLDSRKTLADPKG